MRRMNLNDYLSRPGAETATKLAELIGVNQDQLRQWRHGYGGRSPGPAACVDIERATSGAVRRWDLRPDDWHRIWPELIGSDGAPEVPAPAEASAEQAGG